MSEGNKDVLMTLMFMTYSWSTPYPWWLDGLHILLLFFLSAVLLDVRASRKP